MNATAGGLRVLIACMLAQNLLVGLTFGSFGPLLEQSQAHFGVSRAAMSGGMSVISLVLSVAGAVMGGVMQRFRTRSVMLVGALAAAAAYAGLSCTAHFGLALVCYGVLGFAIALGGILAPLSLVAGTFPDRTGRALGLVNLPLILFAWPFAIGGLLPHIGRQGILFIIAGLLLALAPVLALLLRGGPQAAARPGGTAARASRLMAIGDLLRAPAFWLISLCIGLMAGCGIVFVVHIVPFGNGAGLSLLSSTALISVFAGAGLVGAPLFGWLADRVGALAALVLSGLCQSALWAALLIGQGEALFVIVAALGIASAPMTTLHGAALTAVFGSATAARAMGFGYMVKLPFLFGFAPLAGVIFDATGSYRWTFLACSACLLLATLCALLLLAARQRRAPAPASPASAA